MSNQELIKQLTDEMQKKLPVIHTSSPIVGSNDGRDFVGALVVETQVLENGAMMIIRLWEDGEFEVRTTSTVGEQCADQVKAIWAEQRGLSDGQV